MNGENHACKSQETAIVTAFHAFYMQPLAFHAMRARSSDEISVVVQSTAAASCGRQVVRLPDSRSVSESTPNPAMRANMAASRVSIYWQASTLVCQRVQGHCSAHRRHACIF